MAPQIAFLSLFMNSVLVPNVILLHDRRDSGSQKECFTQLYFFVLGNHDTSH